MRNWMLLPLLAIVVGLGCNSRITQDQMTTNSNDGLSYLALGDSYTIGTSIAFPDNYPSQIKDHVSRVADQEVELKVVAENAWRTDDLMRAIDRADLKPNYDLVSLLIGVNNQYQGMSSESYVPELNALIDTALSKVRNDVNKVVMFSIPNYGYTPFGTDDREKITAELKLYNDTARSICEQRGIAFYDVTQASLLAETEPILVAADSLHPSKEQYALWVEPYLDDIAKKMMAP